MSLTQERIYTAAVEIAYKTISSHLSQKELFDFVDEFLSRIREEQEAAFWTDSEMDCIDTITFTRTEDNNVPLFTIPPAAPCDCSELVEALEELMNESEYQIIEGMPTPYRLMDSCNRAKEALANHAKRMKGEE